MGSLAGAWQLTLGGNGEQADMSVMQSRAARLEEVLSRAFSPTLMRVVNDSARHAGHAGAQPGGETHYTVLLVSEAFRGQNRVTRSRAVHALLKAEFAGGMHALSLILRTPEEQEQAPARP
jgi:BolA family transcriptional regulator, general stress-responsive regulator